MSTRIVLQFGTGFGYLFVVETPYQTLLEASLVGSQGFLQTLEGLLYLVQALQTLDALEAVDPLEAVEAVEAVEAKALNPIDHGVQRKHDFDFSILEVPHSIVVHVYSILEVRYSIVL